MGLDVRDGDFFIVGRVFSLPSVSPFFGRTLFWSWGMLGGGRRLRLTVEVYGGWMAFRGWPRAHAGEILAVLLAGSTTTASVGVVSLLGGVVMALFHILTPGENLVPIFGRAAAASHVVSSLGASFRRSSNASMTADGPFRFKSFHILCSARLRLLGSASFLWWVTCSSSKLLADGGAATLGNDDMLQSLLRSSGVGRVKEVAPRWLG
uniref:Uncharacterized protein n=1 Tax=Oryza nivara TaxID=4536 RepID=A0A0E0IIZ6_ORYNI